MENGKIKFYKPEEYWGMIEVQSQTKNVYFNLQSVKEEFKTLVELALFKDEPITFDMVDSTRKKGEKEARNINLDFSQRKVGYIREYDKERGHGKIEDVQTKQKIFFHFSAFRKDEWYKDKFQSIEVDEPVVFSVGSNDKGKVATDIVKIDKRMFIEKFAFFRDLNKSLTELKELAEPENWDYIRNPKKGIPVLRSYVNQTCKRIIFQKKTVKSKSSKDGKEYCTLNTGLVTPQQDEIFAYFVKNPHFKNIETWGFQQPEWDFLEFGTDQSVYHRYTESIPETATYFSEAEITDLILDTRIRIVPDRDHLIKRKNRVDSDKLKNLDDDSFIDEIKEAIELAKKRIKRNYKTAIPHFYDNKIQFLIPLCMKAKKSEAIAALVVNKNENIYEAHTILSLDQAYNNARLLAKPDREWLNP